MKRLLIIAAPSLLAGAAHAEPPLSSVKSSGYVCEDRRTLKHAWLYIDVPERMVYHQVEGYPAYRAKIVVSIVKNIPTVNEFGNAVGYEPMITDLWWDQRTEGGKTRAMKSFAIYPKMGGGIRYTFGFYGTIDAFSPVYSAECLPYKDAGGIKNNLEKSGEQ